MKKQIVVDLDGVVFNTHTTLEDIVKQRYPNFRMSKVYTWAFDKDLTELPKEVLKKYLSKGDFDKLSKGYQYLLQADRDYIFEVLSDVKLYKKQPFNKKSDRLKKLMIMKDIEVVFSTAIIPSSKANEIAWVKKLRLQDKYAGYDYKLDIHIGNTKPVYKNAIAVIDDHLGNLKPYEIMGSKLLLIDAPFNRFELNPQYGLKDRVIRVKDIGEAVKYCLDYIKRG